MGNEISEASLELQKNSLFSGLDGNEDEALIAAFCHTKKFVDVFNKFEKQKNYLSFNVFAFFLKFLYFFSRKMWAATFVFIVVDFGLSLANGFIGKRTELLVVWLIFYVLCSVLAGVIANWLYYLKYKKILSECKRACSNFDDRVNFMMKKGGMSMIKGGGRSISTFELCFFLLIVEKIAVAVVERLLQGLPI